MNKFTEHIERIEWIDSNSYNGWHNPQITEYEPLKCISYGILIHEDDHQVTLAGSFESETQCADTMTIPKVCISKRELLTITEKQKDK